jgi:hypothetical protein
MTNAPKTAEELLKMAPTVGYKPYDAIQPKQKIFFTREEKLLLRWLVSNSVSIYKSEKGTILMKLDKMLEEDGTFFHIEHITHPPFNFDKK